MAAFAYYAQDQNRGICDQQILDGEDTPVFNFWTEGQENFYDAWMTPMPDGFLLLEGSLIADLLSREAHRDYSGIRSRWVEQGWLEGNQLTVDIPFDAKGLRRMSSLVSGHPNSGTDTRTTAHWRRDAGPGPYQGQTYSDWKEGRH